MHLPPIPYRLTFDPTTTASSPGIYAVNVRRVSSVTIMIRIPMRRICSMAKDGKIRLMMRYADNCRRKKCGGECYVIDTYDGRGKYIGSTFTHEPDPVKAKRILKADRAYWQKMGFEVLR